MRVALSRILGLSLYALSYFVLKTLCIPCDWNEIFITHPWDDLNEDGSVKYHAMVGDEVCHDVANTERCNWDGGDCCMVIGMYDPIYEHVFNKTESGQFDPDAEGWCSDYAWSCKDPNLCKIYNETVKNHDHWRDNYDLISDLTETVGDQEEQINAEMTLLENLLNTSTDEMTGYIDQVSALHDDTANTVLGIQNSIAEFEAELENSLICGHPSLLNNSRCDCIANTHVCAWDGGDCCDHFDDPIEQQPPPDPNLLPDHPDPPQPPNPPTRRLSEIPSNSSCPGYYPEPYPQSCRDPAFNTEVNAVSIHQLGSSLAAITISISSNTQSINTLSETGDSLEEALVNFQYVVSSFSNETALHHGDLNQTVQDIISDVGKVNTSVMKNSDDIADLQTSIAQADDLIADLFNEKVNVSTADQRYEELLESLGARAMVTDLTTLLATVNELSTSLEDQIAFINGSLVSLSSMDTTFEGQMASFTSDIVELNAAGDIQDSEISVLQSDTQELVSLLSGYNLTTINDRIEVLETFRKAADLNNRRLSSSNFEICQFDDDVGIQYDTVYTRSRLDEVEVAGASLQNCNDINTNQLIAGTGCDSCLTYGFLLNNMGNPMEGVNCSDVPSCGDSDITDASYKIWYTCSDQAYNPDEYGLPDINEYLGLSNFLTGVRGQSMNYSVSGSSATWKGIDADPLLSTSLRGLLYTDTIDNIWYAQGVPGYLPQYCKVVNGTGIIYTEAGTNTNYDVVVPSCRSAYKADYDNMIDMFGAVALGEAGVDSEEDYQSMECTQLCDDLPCKGSPLYCENYDCNGWSRTTAYKETLDKCYCDASYKRAYIEKYDEEGNIGSEKIYNFGFFILTYTVNKAVGEQKWDLGNQSDYDITVSYEGVVTGQYDNEKYNVVRFKVDPPCDGCIIEAAANDSYVRYVTTKNESNVTTGYAMFRLGESKGSRAIINFYPSNTIVQNGTQSRSQYRKLLDFDIDPANASLAATFIWDFMNVFELGEHPYAYDQNIIFWMRGVYYLVFAIAVIVIVLCVRFFVSFFTCKCDCTGGKRWAYDRVPDKVKEFLTPTYNDFDKSYEKTITDGKKKAKKESTLSDDDVANGKFMVYTRVATPVESVTKPAFSSKQQNFVYSVVHEEASDGSRMLGSKILGDGYESVEKTSRLYKFLVYLAFLTNAIVMPTVESEGTALIFGSESVSFPEDGKVEVSGESGSVFLIPGTSTSYYLQYVDGDTKVDTGYLITIDLDYPEITAPLDAVYDTSSYVPVLDQTRFCQTYSNDCGINLEGSCYFGDSWDPYQDYSIPWPVEETTSPFYAGCILTEGMSECGCSSGELLNMFLSITAASASKQCKVYRLTAQTEPLENHATIDLLLNDAGDGDEYTASALDAMSDNIEWQEGTWSYPLYMVRNGYNANTGNYEQWVTIGNQRKASVYSISQSYTMSASYTVTISKVGDDEVDDVVTLNAELGGEIDIPTEVRDLTGIRGLTIKFLGSLDQSITTPPGDVVCVNTFENDQNETENAFCFGTDASPHEQPICGAVGDIQVAAGVTDFSEAWWVSHAQSGDCMYVGEASETDKEAMDAVVLGVSPGVKSSSTCNYPLAVKFDPAALDGNGEFHSGLDRAVTRVRGIADGSIDDDGSVYMYPYTYKGNVYEVVQDVDEQDRIVGSGIRWRETGASPQLFTISVEGEWDVVSISVSPTLTVCSDEEQDPAWWVDGQYSISGFQDSITSTICLKDTAGVGGSVTYVVCKNSFDIGESGDVSVSVFDDPACKDTYSQYTTKIALYDTTVPQYNTVSFSTTETEDAVSGFFYIYSSSIFDGDQVSFIRYTWGGAIEARSIIESKYYEDDITSSVLEYGGAGQLFLGSNDAGTIAIIIAIIVVIIVIVVIVVYFWCRKKGISTATTVLLNNAKSS